MGVSYEYREEVAKRFVEDIITAKIVIDDVEYDGVINNIYQEGTNIRILIKLNDYKGKITQIMIYGKDNILIHERYVEVDKLAHAGYFTIIDIDVRSIEL